MYENTSATVKANIVKDIFVPAREFLIQENVYENGF